MIDSKIPEGDREKHIHAPFLSTCGKPCFLGALGAKKQLTKGASRPRA